MRRDWTRERFCVRTDAMAIEDERFDALYDVGLGGSWHPVDSERCTLYFDFADASHPQPGDELSAETIVRPAMERLGLAVYGWWIESEDEP